MSPDDITPHQPDPQPQGVKTVPRPSIQAARILTILFTLAGLTLVGLGTYFGDWYAGLGFVLLIVSLFAGSTYATRYRTDEERARDREDRAA